MHCPHSVDEKVEARIGGLCCLCLQADIFKMNDKCVAMRRELRAEVERLKGALESMCRQFAYWSGAGGYWTGGLSTLEEAFEILGWTDPQPAPKACCQVKGCKKQATCGTPTKDGYKRLCGEHYRQEQALKGAKDV